MEKSEIIVLIFVMVTVLFFSSLMYLDFQYRINTSYEMSNGVICQNMIARGFGGSTTFQDCSDGLVYANPSSYKILERKR